MAESTRIQLTADQWKTLRECVRGKMALEKVLAIFGVEEMPPDVHPPHEGKRILIVDDDETLASMVKVVLEKNSYRTLTAHDAQGGLNLATTEAPDLILLDITMPGMDGGELFAKIRSIPRLQRTPVIFITGLISSDEESDVNGPLEERKQYIGKPFTAEKLLNAISAMLALA